MCYTLNIKKYSLLITSRAVILKEPENQNIHHDIAVKFHSNTGHSNDLLTRQQNPSEKATTLTNL